MICPHCGKEIELKNEKPQQPAPDTAVTASGLPAWMTAATWNSYLEINQY